MSDSYLRLLTTAPISHIAHHPCKCRGVAQTFVLDRLRKHGHHHFSALRHGSTRHCPVKWGQRLGRHSDRAERLVGARRLEGWAGTEGTGTVNGGRDAGSDRKRDENRRREGCEARRETQVVAFILVLSTRRLGHGNFPDSALWWPPTFLG